MQQASDSEKQQYTNSGQSILEKIEPSLDGLGNSKECQRDMKLIFGLFAPDRYGIKKYGVYDVTRLGDNLRLVKTLKSNISKCNQRIAFYFNGACSYFKELSLNPSETDYTNVKNDTY